MMQKLYNMLPVFLQSFLISLAGIKLNATRYGRNYYKYRKFYKKFDTLPFAEKLAYQNQKLQDFIIYVNTHSPFYKDLYKDIDLTQIKSAHDLKILPAVNKDDLRQHMTDVATIPDSQGVVSRTGGTTGISLKVIISKDDMMHRMAMLDHFKSRLGFENRRMKRASFTSRHIIPPGQHEKKFWRYNMPSRQMLYSVYHLSDENMPYYIASLNKFKPHALDSNLAPIRDLATYMRRHNIRLDFKLKAIFPTAETLTRFDRRLFKEVFDVDTFDQYASGEGAPFITECPHGTLHIEMASGIFEHFDKVSPEVLVTSFTTHGTPLLRYKIGDAVIMSDQTTCPCGIESLIAKEIIGRRADFLYTTSLAKVYNISSLVKNIPNAVIKMQVLQDKVGHVTALLQVDPDKFEPAHEDIFRRDFAYRIGADTVLTIHYVEDIAKEVSGKFRLVKNTVALEILK